MASGPSSIPVNSCETCWLKCEVWQVPAPVGARLLCARNSGTIAQQAPFLMSAHVRQVEGSNAYIELLPRALLKFVKDNNQVQADPDDDESDREAARLGHDQVGELFASMNGMSWDLTLHEDSVDVAQHMPFVKAEGLLPLSLVGRAGRHDAVPDSFWRLPSDSDMALYFEGADPTRIRAAWSRSSHALLGYAAENIEFPASAMVEKQRIVEGLFPGGPAVVAYVRDLIRASEVLNKDPKPLKAGRPDVELQKVNTELGGWCLIGLDDDPQLLLGLLHGIDSLDSKHYPHRKGMRDTPTATFSTFRERPLKSPESLPAGSMKLEYKSRPNPKYVAKTPDKVPPVAAIEYLIAAPEQGRLWVAFASDEATAVSRLQSVLAEHPAKTLSSDTELRQLAVQSLAGLGYASIAGFVGASLSADSRAEAMKSCRRLASTWILPSKGATHIPVWITTDAPAGITRRVTWNARLGRNALADLVSLALSPPSDDSTLGDD